VVEAAEVVRFEQIASAAAWERGTVRGASRGCRQHFVLPSAWSGERDRDLR
jgi:hypothetical protein